MNRLLREQDEPTCSSLDSSNDQNKRVRMRPKQFSPEHGPKQTKRDKKEVESLDDEQQIQIESSDDNMYEMPPIQVRRLKKGGHLAKARRRKHGRATTSAESSEGIEELFETRVCEWDTCETPFDTHKDLVGHVAINHVQQEKHFMCRWKSCERREPFRQQYQLVAHVRQHTGERPFVCQVADCAKSYSRSENLKTHMRTHTGERPYECEFPDCDAAFSNASDKHKHQSRTHSGEKPFECNQPTCFKSYTDPSSLRKHIVNSHGEWAYEQWKKNKKNEEKPATLEGRSAKMPSANDQHDKKVKEEEEDEFPLFDNILGNEAGIKQEEDIKKETDDWNDSKL
ncbi:hypothetical protein PENTCL1PPCAC_29188 [Pristionchus entomophagus]|uniref:Wilms tumor protein homolog n=1 Tax=Pristionchus entomophagus TaxID=358040 RepID=A0AAV5UM64_9BILA|nr:hypothetical protein PENTCL1PPCAC_29188 [Pristionchus entomophagus]